LPDGFGHETPVLAQQSELLRRQSSAAVPEASTWAMMLIGFVGLGYARYRRAREPRAI
jgi:hypothetical protein